MSTMRPQHLLKQEKTAQRLKKRKHTCNHKLSAQLFFRQYGYPWGSFFIIAQKQAGKDAVYVIKEAAKPGVTAAANMVVAFPVYELIKQADGTYQYGAEELSMIHLYPKNIVENDGTLQVTKIGSAEGEALNGAEFVIVKQESEVTKYIQGVAQGMYTWTSDKSKAKHFVSGNRYEIGEEDFCRGRVLRLKDK